ncbi:MAG TPA: uracil-DNA glycosylase family protein, partial [Verrucomicrobiae bacterium]|nr:uracil-DNA glycosylase family protein [Verrucomicrobiae bacterium]
DRPPRRECAPAWHERLRGQLPGIKLTLLVGQYAQAHYLGDRRKPTMSETVRAWRDYAPEFIPLPHPSWRNTGWLKKNTWFELELVPALRQRIADL